MMNLKEVVERYRKIAPRFSVPISLSCFDLGAEETTKVFSSLDEDYHISRFFHFSNVGGKRFVVSGELASHVAIDEQIKTVL